MILNLIIFLVPLILHAHAFTLQEVEPLHTLVVGGQTAPPGRIPYQASMRLNLISHFCGASILNQRWLSTAAHCTDGQSVSSITIVVGTNIALIGGVRYSLETIIAHENYDPNTISNDISVVKTSRDMKFNDLVQPIALPVEDTGVNHNLLLSGWGRISYPGPPAILLQMINLTSISVADCQSAYTGIISVTELQICTLTRAGEGACHGDSGGPLVDNNTLAGIVSLGKPCAIGAPDVYTRVYSYLSWITPKIVV